MSMEQPKIWLLYMLAQKYAKLMIAGFENNMEKWSIESPSQILSDQ